jgi:AcrR family transcriptional regulator
MESEIKRPKGRPLSFDLDQVLDEAVLVFWSKGYEGASLDDLTKAMGINRPSLYAQFGNKHGLFLAAIDRYVDTISRPQSVPLMEEKDVVDAVSGYYREIVKCVSEEGRPAGCLIASVATEIAERDGEVRRKVTEILGAAEDFINSRLTAEGYGAQGDSRPVSVTGAMIVAAGLSFAPRARLGGSREELTAIANGYVQQFFDRGSDSSSATKRSSREQGELK